MAKILVRMSGVRNIENAKLTDTYGGGHPGSSCGTGRRTWGPFNSEQASRILEVAGTESVRIDPTLAGNIDEKIQNFEAAMPDLLHLSGGPNEHNLTAAVAARVDIIAAYPVVLDAEKGGGKVAGNFNFYQVDSRKVGS